MNAKSPKPKLNRQILDEASDWFVDFRVGDVDSTARERFDLWLRQSPEHIRAYMEIANTYVVLPALNPTRKVDVQELIAYARSEGNVVPFDHTARPNQREEGHPLSSREQRAAAKLAGERSRMRVSRRFAFAAVLLVATASTWFIAQWNTYATDIGERRSITLADGSTIDLDARSRVKVKFSKRERDVELVEGQALFGVAHDASRPFIVSAGNTAVRAVGTQFDVYRKRSGTTVTVVEGRVAVFGPTHPVALNPSPTTGESSAPRVREGRASPGGPSHLLAASSYAEGPRSAGEVFVSAGEQVTVTDRPMPAPEPANVAAATAWTQHQLVFDGSPLSDVVYGFNRYNTRQIVIEDPALDDFHVSGVYFSTDPASLMRFLRQQPGIDVIETDAGVRITRK
jgi:transmembrane sensor